MDGRSDLFALGGGWTGHKQLFDRANDPHQLRNLAGKRPRTERRLEQLTPDPY